MSEVKKTIQNLENKYNMKLTYQPSHIVDSMNEDSESSWLRIKTEINNINDLNSFIKDIQKSYIFKSKKFYSILIDLKKGFNIKQSELEELYSTYIKVEGESPDKTKVTIYVPLYENKKIK